MCYSAGGLWQVRFFNQGLEAEILDLPAGLLARFVRYTERLEQFGPHIGMPHVRPMGRGLYELRLSAKEGIARVFFCVTSSRQIVFLHQFVKKTGKTPSKELEVAHRRMRSVKNG